MPPSLFPPTLPSYPPLPPFAPLPRRKKRAADRKRTPVAKARRPDPRGGRAGTLRCRAAGCPWDLLQPALAVRRRCRAKRAPFDPVAIAELAALHTHTAYAPSKSAHMRTRTNAHARPHAHAKAAAPARSRSKRTRACRACAERVSGACVRVRARAVRGYVRACAYDGCACTRKRGPAFACRLQRWREQAVADAATEAEPELPGGAAAHALALARR